MWPGPMAVTGEETAHQEEDEVDAADAEPWGAGKFVRPTGAGTEAGSGQQAGAWAGPPRQHPATFHPAFDTGDSGGQ